MRKSLISVLKIIVGLSLMYLIFSKIEWNEFIETVTRINPIYLYINIMLFFFPGVWLSVLKWETLLKIQKIYVPFKQLYLYYLIGTFFNNFLPSTVGGDISRVMYLKRATNMTNEVTASIIMERFMGLLALIFLGMLSVIFDVSFISRFPILAYIILLFISLLTTVYFISGNHAVKRYFNNRKLLTSFWKKAVGLFEVLFKYREHKKVLIYTFIISILFVMSGVLATYLYLLSISIEVPIFKLIFIYSVVQLLGILPVSINSLGVSEGAFIILFGLIGISSVDALTVALLGRVLLMLVSLSGGIAFILKGKILTFEKKRSI